MPLRTIVLDWKRVIAEVAIIVTGVLIALAADNWRESRRDQALRLEYLRSLGADLRDDLREIEVARQRGRINEQSARLLIAVAQGSASSMPSPYRLVRAFERAGYVYLPTISAYTFEDLQSTGNLHLIRDFGLRRQIAAYYNRTAGVNQWNDHYRQIQAQYRRDARGLIPGDLRVGVNRGDSLSVTAEHANRIIEALRSRPEITADLHEMLWIQARIQEQALALQEAHCKKLLYTIEAAIAEEQ